ncbi:hypothetical protein GW17_00045436 [Ensete ventricosum]|nr:hypothetical protein GW17_00045436 [Ensete ventricosum]
MRPCKVGYVAQRPKKIYVKLIEVRGIANSKNLVLMQGLETEVCNKFRMLLDLEGCSRGCIGNESQSSNGDVTKRPHGAADRGGIVYDNTTHAEMSREGHDHAKVVKRGEEAMTSLERRWTRRSAIVSKEASLPKSKASVRKEMDSEECHIGEEKGRREEEKEEKGVAAVVAAAVGKEEEGKKNGRKRNRKERRKEEMGQHLCSLHEETEEVLCDGEEKGGRRGEEKEEKGGKKKRKGEEEKGKKGLQLWQLLRLGKKKGKEEEEGRGIREEEKGEKWKKGLQLWQLRLGKEEGG